MQQAASVFLMRAAQCDAAGQHDAAINELAQGTAAGDAGCADQLGIRLLTGDRSPHLPAEGLRFIVDACAQGQGAGAARAAALVAMGVAGAPDWRAGLDWLRRSAEAGWNIAQRQLLALCDDRDMARQMATAAQPSWRSLAAAVQLERWRHAPPPQVKSQEPRVSTFTGLVRPELCEFFIALAVGRLEPARVYDPVARQDIVAAHRNNTIANFDLRTVQLAHVLLQARMAAACGVPEQQMEAPSVLHYFPGEQIADHFDFVDPLSTSDYAAEIARNGQRLITFLIYLNDDYDGGETAFPKLGFSHRGTLGGGIYFVNALADLQPDLRMLHAGCPTTRGEKWIITQFVRSRAMR
jgi:hypothetical protein